MDQKIAVELLNDTFNQDFNIDRYSKFIKELFNHFNIRINKNIPLRKEYYDYIAQMDSLGVYTDNNKDSIEVFAVKLKKSSSRDRARTMQRNLIAKYLKISGSKAALVAFYGDDPQDWRFSFVKIEYDLIKDEKGNLKVKEDITPARRYSFLVGKNEPNHTCRRQFLSLIKEENDDPNLQQIEKAFNIESVTKEFFEEYKKLFLNLQESLEKVIQNDEVIRAEFNIKSIPIADFAKKLMGQIVFIYFLQKKGWLGVDKGQKWGDGPRNFLRKLYNKEMVDYENFFNDILEPLFYEALATSRDGDYYRHFDCKIPFLNGGLFEPINDYDWVNTEIILKNQVFKDILDVFDLYNFTIKEDEPLEKEVAVDPEMLGKVFENLLDVKDRKFQGAYYTPREIVHYMCQESLINYLYRNSNLSKKDIENFIHLGDFALDLLIREVIQFGKLREDHDYGLPAPIKENYEKLDILLQKIKVVDPAVGSGAFPVGMMNEIVKARSILSFLSNKEKSNYQLKLEIIRDCLYGVDIDSSAVDIAKLRFWLSLIVDEENLEKIDPLPNLDHKIMCGNSLLDEFKGKKLFDEKLLGDTPSDNDEKIKDINKRIETLYNELGKIHTGKTKDESLKSEIDNEIRKLDRKKKKLQSKEKDDSQQFTLDDDYRKRIKESQLKLNELQKLQKLFFKEQNTKLKKKYRAEIEKIEWKFIEETLQENNDDEAIERLKQYQKNKSKPFFLWKLYFHEVFQGQNPGFDVVIANPPYIGEKENKEKFREIKSSKWGSKFYESKMDYFYFFFHKALDITRKSGSVTFITTNYYITADGALKLRKDFKNRSIIRKMINFNELKIFEGARGQHNLITFLSEGSDDNAFSINATCKKTGDANEKILTNIIEGFDIDTKYYKVKQKNLYEGKEDYIRLEGSMEGSDDPINLILNKVRKNGTQLKNLCLINSGADVTISRITQRHLNNFQGNYNKGDGVFVISEEEFRRINPNFDEKDVIKDFIKNSDIGRYSIKKNKGKLIYLKWEDNIDKFPNLKSHLSRFKEILEDQANRYSENYPWFALHRPRDQNIFDAPEKILVPYRNKENIFGYSKEPIYSSRDVFFIRPKNPNIKLKYVLALLNSKLYYLWLYFKGKRKGETLELYNTPLSNIPIKEIPEDEQLKFIELVDKIIEMENTNNKDFERIQLLIDEMVYGLYDIEPDEKYIIEDFFIEGR